MTLLKHHDEGFAHINGTTLAFEVAGEGKSLVLLHGGFVDQRLWDEQFPVFAQHYQVARYDLRGFGKSAPVSAETPPFSHIDDLFHLLNALQIGQATLLGLSLGGSVALDFTLAYPERVQALVLTAPSISGFAYSPSLSFIELYLQLEHAQKQGNIALAAESMTKLWLVGTERTVDDVSKQAYEHMYTMVKHYLLTHAKEHATASDPLLPAAVERLAEIHVPTLIVVGDKDEADLLRAADKLEADIVGAKKVILPDAGHHLNLDQPAAFQKVVQDFLTTIK